MFLTREDPRAQIKGSRDPLGVQALWAAFGRRLVGNLTTITTSIRNFTVLLLGRYFAERLVEAEKIGEEQALSVFLRWEQIAGYVRHLVHNAGGDIRGIDRVRRHVAESNGTVPIGTGAEEIILSDQKTYGLWGLFTVSARVSSLLPDGLVGVAGHTREFLERRYRPLIGKEESALLGLIKAGGNLSARTRDPLVSAVGRALDPGLSSEETTFYARWLRDGEGVADAFPGRQARLAALMADVLDLGAWIGRAEVLALAKAARPRDAELADRLEKIAALEALLAPAQALFDYLLARRNQRPEDIGRLVRDHWGSSVPNLEDSTWRTMFPEIQEVAGPEVAAIMADVHEGLAGGSYAAVARRLLDWNRLVMDGRGGAPWIMLEQGKLDVRYGGPEVTLPSRDELPVLWRNPYFLDALRLITKQLAEGIA